MSGNSNKTYRDYTANIWVHLTFELETTY